MKKFIISILTTFIILSSVNVMASTTIINKGTSKFLDEQGIVHLNMDIQKIIDNLQHPVINIPGQSYISMNTSEEGPIRLISDISGTNHIQYWIYTLNFDEVNGVGLNINQMIETHYSTDKKSIYRSYNNSEIKELLGGTNYIPANGHKSLYRELKRNSIAYTVWTIRGVDDNGHNVEYYYTLELSQFLSPMTVVDKPKEDIKHDTPNLRYNAKFEIRVAPGVYWASVNSLGTTNYTNDEIATLLSHSPTIKKNKIDSLYEAIQLYQIGGFIGTDRGAHINKSFNNISWEFHIPGHEAVRLNNGDCSTSANWLAYLLENDYDEVGLMGYSLFDGSGHVFNYFKQDEYYYIIDMTKYRLDAINNISIESGQKTDYLKSDSDIANLHKVSNLQDYISYMQQLCKDSFAYIYIYEKEIQVPDIGSKNVNTNNVMLYFPINCNIKFLYKHPKSPVSIHFIQPPSYKPDWSVFPSLTIKSVLPWK